MIIAYYLHLLDVDSRACWYTWEALMTHTRVIWQASR